MGKDSPVKEENMKLVEHQSHKGMYYVQWPDGTLSADFYNKTRAKEFCKTIPEQERENKLPLHRRTPAQSPLEARTCV